MLIKIAKFPKFAAKPLYENMRRDFDKLKVYQSKLSEQDFWKISNYIEKKLGIKMPLNKILMVQNRLYKRLIALQIPTFEQYVRFIFSPEGKQELEELANVLTTNKTEFFREADHFEVLRDIVTDGKMTGVQVWSAACASGEEVYSIAITLSELNVTYSVIGTDISQRVLEIAQKGVYPEEVCQPIPFYLINKYFDTKIIDNKRYYVVKSFLKKSVKFFRLNLMEDYTIIPNNLDIIFLRNVLIYFKPETQYQVLKKILKKLKNSGYLFLGHSEAIFEFKLPLQRIAPSVYKKL